jgi:hypothetical protein
MSTASGKIGHKEIAKLHQRGDICWDGQLKGFGARRSENSVAFVLMYRTREGRQRWYTIGRYGSPWAPDTAREEAKRLLYEVARGDDPAEVKIKARYAETVEDLCNEYIEEAISGRLRIRGGREKKASTLKSDRCRIDCHVVPRLGKRSVAAVTQQDPHVRIIWKPVAGTTQSTTGESGYFLAVLSGDRGRTAAAAEGPWSDPWPTHPPGALTI